MLTNHNCANKESTYSKHFRLDLVKQGHNGRLDRKLGLQLQDLYIRVPSSTPARGVKEGKVNKEIICLPKALYIRALAFI
uniref:Uncharacterized protein n=1 Tax=Pyxicephalus adspersus TaxID=30357 RepID=A0AAV3B465_PYXAD|nr:TPA: hypothetical protein GDO54_000270 [Pyxicephalus adspersus]